MKSSKKLLVLLSAAAIGLCSTPAVLAQGSMLRGSVNANGFGPGNDTSLSRSDLNKGGGDPFAGNGGNGGSNDGGALNQAIDPGSFNVQAMLPQMPAPPSGAQRAFGLGANQDGQGNFQGQSMPGVQQQMPMQPQMPTQPLNAQQFNPNDPDNAPEMKLEWDAWHKRVAEAIYARFSQMANAAFARSRPLAASCAYTVTSNGHVTNVHMLQKNMNPVFNALVLAAVSSLDGQSQLLAFPQGSHRPSVEKSGTFTQNYGYSGFRHTINDRETVR